MSPPPSLPAAPRSLGTFTLRFTLVAAFTGITLLVSLVIVFTSHLHGPLSMDHPGSVQTAHIHPTPRIGGVGIYLGLFLAWLLLVWPTRLRWPGRRTDRDAPEPPHE